MFLGASLLLIHLNPGDIFPNVNSALSLITLFRSNVNIIAYICLGKICHSNGTPLHSRAFYAIQSSRGV